MIVFVKGYWMMKVCMGGRSYEDGSVGRRLSVTAMLNRLSCFLETHNFVKSGPALRVTLYMLSFNIVTVYRTQLLHNRALTVE